MEFIPGSFASLCLFILVVMVVISSVLWGARQVGGDLFKQLTLFMLIWICGLSTLVLSGAPRQYIIPIVPMILVTILGCGLGLGMSEWGKKLSTLPVWYLVFFQSFRLPLELVLHLWAGTETVPNTMTWTGQNWDILSGFLAALVAIPFFRRKMFYWLVNSVGIALLFNVLRVVLMSSPFPFSWNMERPLQLIFYMPYSLIAYVCVWGAVLGHVVLTRALFTSEGRIQ